MVPRVKTILEPLAITANITQAPHTRLDHVLLTLGFWIYSNPELDNTVQNVILASIEKRWKAADQDVFITAVFLNLYIRGHYFNHAAITEANLYNIIAWVFEQIFSQKADINMLKAFMDYARSQGEFSSTNMLLDQMAEIHKSEVSNQQRLRDTANIPTNITKNLPLDLVLVWTWIDTGACNGRNSIVKLAMYILSVIANSAGTERAFSDFGITHTKRRNKLDPEKVHKTGVLKMDLQRAHNEAGLTRSRRKRVFGEVDEPSRATEAVVPGDEDLEFHDLETQLIQDAEAADVDVAEEDMLIPPILPPTTVLPLKIPLSLLFDYATPSGSGLEFYWKGGLKNLEQELAAYDLLYGEENDIDTTAKTHTSGCTEQVDGLPFYTIP